jgi:NAD(P)-dependent dehydrogenase (short-subunit alcohol dehydrogenase family)
MNLENAVHVVTGGGGGLGSATARRLALAGGRVVVSDIMDIPTDLFSDLGHQITFVKGDVRSETDMQVLFATAAELGEFRGLVHCPGRGFPRRILDRSDAPFPLEDFKNVIELNLIGTFNSLRLAAEQMAKNQTADGNRGVIVMTASVAAYEGQIGQIAYAAAKAAIIGMTICAARDLSDRAIRVATIAPGIFDTPLLARLPEDVKDGLGASVPHPKRLGDPDEYAALAEHILRNDYLNGEVIRLDGAIRMALR